MDNKSFKQLIIPKIEAGKMTEVVRDVIKGVQASSKMCTNKRRKTLSQSRRKYKGN